MYTSVHSANQSTKGTPVCKALTNPQRYTSVYRANQSTKGKSSSRELRNPQMYM